MDLTDNEKRDIRKYLEADKPLPDKYRFLLFGEKREVELVWNYIFPLIRPPTPSGLWRTPLRQRHLRVLAMTMLILDGAAIRMRRSARAGVVATDFLIGWWGATRRTRLRPTG